VQNNSSLGMSMDIQQGEQDLFDDLARMDELSIRWLKGTGKYICLV
jgi:hypothetical protein